MQDPNTPTAKISAEAFAKIKAGVKQSPTRIRIVSGSMMPYLKIAETYWIEACEIKDLEPFDIIVFYDGKRLIGHYVWHINKNISIGTITTRCTQSRSDDIPVDEDAVLGKVIDVKLPWYFKTWVTFKSLINRDGS